ncbi:CDP-diacylglycerol--glycerol-3-phosphate 3-phosphatidyltransferase [Numidum massiliense]|uniref:CDP-diacylglycerol--glycerol-3-phosphate 3-phosphatidyltransferase n=1 Tax=Numidum massiliense TaxID=1522315 RepID=UPI0006D5814E|nr:CDP-diacylglycerol--glycerol-3-phosphate 3-phosphatidyltransferase [Numidum massiliense]
MNLPNKITLSRIVLIPVIIVFLSVPFDFGKVEFAGSVVTVSELVAVIVFIIAASTDGLDGYIARKHKLVTTLGKLLDPLADKLLLTAALVSLVEMQRIDAWIVIVIISREFAVTGLRLIAIENGRVIAASKLAKWKTTIQIVAVISLMLNNFPFSIFSIPFSQIAIWAAVVITVWSGIDYFYKNKEILMHS